MTDKSKESQQAGGALAKPARSSFQMVALPAEDIVKNAEMVARSGNIRLERVRVPGGGGKTFTIFDDECVERQVETLDGVMLGYRDFRVYWSGSAEEGSAPDCKSDDMVIGHGDPGGICEACPNNQWGSGGTEKSKACKEKKELLFLPSNRIVPIIVTIPPTSLTPFASYILMTVGRGRLLEKLVTRIGVSVKKSGSRTFGQLAFASVGALDDETHGTVKRIRDLFMPILQRPVETT